LQLSEDHFENARPDPLGPAPSFPPGTGRRLKIGVAGFALLLLAGFLVIHFTHRSQQNQLAREALASAAAPIPVEVVTARSQAAGRPLVLPGETAAWYESTIYSRVSGYVGGWTADIGDKVKAGQVLATIDTPELDADLAAAAAKLRAAEAEVSLREAEATFAGTTYARWRDSPKGVVSEQEREDKKAAFESAQARLVAAHAQVNVDQAEVDRFRAYEKFKQVTAPYAGTITERRIDIGNLVSAGSSSQTTLLYKMAEVDQIRIFVDVPQGAAADLMKPGVPVRITVHDLKDCHFDGKITRTAEAIDPHARTFRAEIDLPNSDLALLPGMYVEAAFELANHNTVQIPASALIFQSGGPHVARLEDNGKVHFQAVTIARDDGTVIELSQGVAAGDRVVLNVSNQITEGDAVTVKVIDGKPAVAP
jgi:RND family efflux transporter MFP subunit